MGAGLPSAGPREEYRSCFEKVHVKKLPFSGQDLRRKVKYFMNTSEVPIQIRIVALAQTTSRGLTEIPPECIQFPVCVGTELGAVGCCSHGFVA